MLFKNKPKRKYIGILVIILSTIFLLAQLGPYLVSGKTSPSSSDLATVTSIAGIITGIYLVAGSLPALIAMIPVAASGCVGCGGGGGGEEEEEGEDLGEPPQPPTAGHIIP